MSKKRACRNLKRRGKKLGGCFLLPGDVVLLAHGGHGFTMLEPSEMIEVKQGPYAGEQDKERFAPAAAESIRIAGQTQP